MLRLCKTTEEGSSHHAFWVGYPHPTEELVCAEDLLMPGNEITFEQESNRAVSLNICIPKASSCVRFAIEADGREEWLDWETWVPR